MSDPSNLDPTHLVRDGLLGMALAIVGFFTRRAINRLDLHGNRLNELEQTYVSRDELHNFMTQMRGDRQAMHDENQDALHQLRDQVQDLNTNLLNTVLRK